MHWGIVMAGILAYDYWLMATGHPSLSSVYRASSRHHPLLVGGATSYLIAHLWGYLPHRADALHGFGMLASR